MQNQLCNCADEIHVKCQILIEKIIIIKNTYGIPQHYVENTNVAVQNFSRIHVHVQPILNKTIHSFIVLKNAIRKIKLTEETICKVSIQRKKFNEYSRMKHNLY